MSNSLIRRAYHPPPHTRPCARTPPLKRTPNARRARRTPVPNDVHKLVRHPKCLGTTCLLWYNCKTCRDTTVSNRISSVRPNLDSCVIDPSPETFPEMCVCVCVCVCCVVLCCVVGSRGFPPNASNIIIRAEHPCARTSRNGTHLTCRCAPVDTTATTARAHLRRHLELPVAPTPYYARLRCAIDVARGRDVAHADVTICCPQPHRCPQPFRRHA